MKYNNVIIENTGPHYVERTNVKNWLELQSAGGDKVLFYPDGKIEIVGDARQALGYLINTCRQAHLDKDNNNNNNCCLSIYDFLIIDTKNLTITNKSSRIYTEYFIIKNIIEREFFRKMKLKAFW
jgi:hypothetical protein